MRIALAALLLSACVADSSSTNPLPACAADVSLDGNTISGTQQAIGQDTVDTEGTTVCLHLDATTNSIAAHFSADSDYSAGPTPFVVTLHDTDGTMLAAGEDVSLPETYGPLTNSRLDWNTPTGGVIDTILWIRARDLTVLSTFTLALRNPIP